MSEVVLLRPNTDRLQQVADYVRGCSTSTKYWPSSTSCRLCQRLSYFDQILTVFKKLQIMSEVVLLRPNTDRLQQVEDYVRGCPTSTKYWPNTRMYPSWILRRLANISTFFNSLSNRLRITNYCLRSVFSSLLKFTRFIQGNNVFSHEMKVGGCQSWNEGWRLGLESHITCINR
jgi:hypothetical protein